MTAYKSGYTGNELSWLKFFYSFIDNCSNSEQFLEQYIYLRSENFSVIQSELKTKIERLMDSRKESQQSVSEIEALESKLGYALPKSMKDFYLSGCLDIYNSIITYSNTANLLDVTAIDYCTTQYPELIDVIKEDYIITKKNASRDTFSDSHKYDKPSNYINRFPSYSLFSFFPLEIKKRYRELLLISASDFVEFVTLMLPYEQTVDNEYAIWLYETGLELKHYSSFAEYIVVELIAETSSNGDEVNISDLKLFNADYILDLDILSNR